MSRLKTLTEHGHRIHLGKVKAHTGVEGNIIADAAAKSVVTQKIIDAGGNLNLIPDEDLEAAGIDDACEISNNAHEHHEWPVRPIPGQEGMDEKALLEMQGLLKEGTWPDGLRQDERERMAALMAGRQATPAAALGNGAEDDKWQARNLTASLSRALRRSCRLGYSDADSLYARLWRDNNPMMLPSLALVLGAIHKVSLPTEVTCARTCDRKCIFC